MAVDDRDKRASAIGIGQPTVPILPNPDADDESQADRQQLAYAYAGILAGLPQDTDEVADAWAGPWRPARRELPRRPPEKGTLRPSALRVGLRVGAATFTGRLAPLPVPVAAPAVVPVVAPPMPPLPVPAPPVRGVLRAGAARLAATVPAASLRVGASLRPGVARVTVGALDVAAAFATERARLSLQEQIEREDRELLGGVTWRT